MRNEIVNELKKCVDVVIPTSAEQEDCIIIPKLKPLDAYKLQPNKCYILRVNATAANNDTLKVNWNKNQELCHEYLKACFSLRLAKMCKFDAIGYDYVNQQDINYIYQDFWLPQESFEIIEELD